MLRQFACPVLIFVQVITSGAGADTVKKSSAPLSDDCKSIRDDLRRLSPQGGVVTIPAGVFECRSMVLIDRSHVVLRGAGRDRTILRLADRAHAPVLVIGDARVIQNEKGDWVTVQRVENVEVSNLTVDGNLANQDPWRECGNRSCDGDPISIRNNAITVRGASNVRIRNVTTHSAISGGLVTEKFCKHLHVENFISYGNYFDGLAGCQTEQSLFENFILMKNRAAGISLDIKDKGNHFRNGLIFANGDVGIFARDISDMIFENLRISHNGSHGIYLSDTGHPDSCANRNEFRSLLIDNSGGHGIHLASACTGNKVTGRSVLLKIADGCFHVHPNTVMDVDRSVKCLP